MRKNEKNTAAVKPIVQLNTAKTGAYCGEWLKSVILCASPLVFMILFHLLKITDESNVKMFMRLSLMAVVGYGGYLAYKGKLDAAKAVMLIIIAGVIMRTGYTIYTNAFTRSMDMNVNSPDGTGHWAYLYRVLHGALPDSNEYQFYHPPLYYMISSIFVRAAVIVTRGSIDNLDNYTYMAQTVSCIASCVTLVTFAKVMDEIKIGKRLQIIPLLLTAFYPAQMLVSGRMNNDSLVFMFMTLALYFTAKWHNKQTLGTIIGIAVTIGCAMMSKLNGALIAFVSGPVMIYHFVKRVKSKDASQIKDIVIQLLVFAVIVFPLGLWYPIRNYILFKQPLNYVYDCGPSYKNYTGDEPWFERWIHIPFFNYPTVPFCTSDDASVWMRLIKTGVYGEFSWNNVPSVLSWVIDYAHAALLVLCAAAVIFTAIKDKTISKVQKYMPVWLWILTFASYVNFNIGFPYMSTADFRYMLLWQMTAGVFVGYFTDYCFRNRENRKYKLLFGTDMALVLLFCVLSIMQLA